MEKYIVKPEDLKEKIKDFPLEVVQRMVNCHIEQYGEIYLKDIALTCVIPEGLFEWSKTQEGSEFWNDVINHENFDLFFKKYPKSGVSDIKVSNVPNLKLIAISFIATLAFFSFVILLCWGIISICKTSNDYVAVAIIIILSVVVFSMQYMKIYKNIKEIYTNKNN